ncbi:MAG: alpha-2-macroglobulin family protein, partial [Acidobacteriota bacterium]
HAVLRASDDLFDGVARYLSDPVDELVATREVTSADDALRVPLPAARAGVYRVEVEARDRLGRAQVVARDLFVATAAATGDADTDGVTWPKPSTPVVALSSDQDRYRPGTTARLVIQSPFQRAEALVMIEAPEGARYRWQSVRGGQATIEVPIETHHAPGLPVHVALLRGRVADAGPPRPGSGLDLGKPVTLGATTVLAVEPIDHRVEVALAHPAKALPGQTIDVTVRLQDPDGAPLDGEVTLWLVDQAVLALGREARRDPLPDFLPPHPVRLAWVDSRGLAFGAIPFAPQPGGGVAQEARALLDRQTVRRDIRPVPFYAQSIQVGPSGEATVSVDLPDNLTVFQLRAKATSGARRFGSAASAMAVRLPVIVQPALPRFVRPGDRFIARGLARVVEGDGGAGRFAIAAEGLLADDAAPAPADAAAARTTIEGDVTLDAVAPTPLALPRRVPAAARGDVGLRLTVARTADGAGDAFEIALPVRPDRRVETRRVLGTLTPGEPWPVPDIEMDDGGVAAVRPGT